MNLYIVTVSFAFYKIEKHTVSAPDSQAAKLMVFNSQTTLGLPHGLAYSAELAPDQLEDPKAT